MINGASTRLARTNVKMSIADLYQFISSKITNKVGKIIKSEHGAVETAIVDTLDSLKYNKTGGEIDGVVDVVTERVGKCFRVKDKATGFILLDIDEYGHVNSYGTPNTAPYASGGFNVWRNGQLRLQMVTEGGHLVLNMYNNSNVLVMKLHAAGTSQLLGGNTEVKGLVVQKIALPEVLTDGAIERNIADGELYFTNGTVRNKLGGDASSERRFLNSTQYSYCGVAPSNSAEDSSVWKISRMEFIETGVETLVLFDVKWSDVLILNFE